MSVLMIGQVEQAAIKAALERARRKPIPFDVVAASAIDQATDVVTLAERRASGGDFIRPKSEQVLLPVGYRLAISYEQQPAGLCLHLSLSLDNKPGFLPGEDAFALAVAACGFDWTLSAGRSWIEEFTIDGEPGGLACNVLIVVEPNRRRMQ